MTGEVRQMPRSLRYKESCGTANKCRGYQHTDQYQLTPLEAISYVLDQVSHRLARGTLMRLARTVCGANVVTNRSYTTWTCTGDGLEQTRCIWAVYTGIVVCNIDAIW